MHDEIHCLVSQLQAHACSLGDHDMLRVMGEFPKKELHNILVEVT